MPPTKPLNNQALQRAKEAFYGLGIKERGVFLSWLKREREQYDHKTVSMASVLWNNMVDFALEQWGLDIEYGKSHDATRVRTLVLLNIHEKWVPGITYVQLSEITGLHKSTISRSCQLTEPLLKKPRVGVWLALQKYNDAIVAHFNELNTREE